MPSFDIVSQIDLQEVRNAVDQAVREITTRYDFKGTHTNLALTDEGIVVESETESRVDAAVDVLQSKLIKRKISLKAMTYGKPELVSGGRTRVVVTLNQGISKDTAREIVQKIKREKLKVQTAIQGDQLRVTGKARDDLQFVIAMLRNSDMPVALQYINMRD